MWIAQLTEEELQLLADLSREALDKGMQFALGFDQSDNSFKMKTGFYPVWSPPIQAEKR